MAWELDDLMRIAGPTQRASLQQRMLEQAKTEGKTEARRTLDAERRQDLTIRFETIWAWLDGPDLEKEVAFHPDRKWRFDYAHPDTKVAIEVDGGAWVQGGHNRGTRFHSDAEKMNQAQILGWVVFRLPTSMVRDEVIESIIGFIRQREAEA